MFNSIRAKYPVTSLPVRIANMIMTEECEDDEVTDCLVDLESALTLGLNNRIAAAEDELETAFDMWLNAQHRSS